MSADPRIAAWNALEVKRREMLRLRARACYLNLPGIRALTERRVDRLIQRQAEALAARS